MGSLKYQGFLRRQCPVCKHMFITKSNSMRYCSRRCRNEAEWMRQRVKQPNRVVHALKKEWFVIKHNQKIAEHVMELIRKRKQQNSETES